MTTIIALILAVPILYFLPNVAGIGPILKQLGVNETAPLMAVFFGISCYFVSQFIVKPYKANLDYRKKNTGGSLDEANNIAAETEKLVADYQIRMKAQNETAQSVYEKLRNEGRSEEEKLVTAARKQGSDLVAQTKNEVATEISAARETMKGQVPQISEMIASRVLGRDLS